MMREWSHYQKAIFAEAETAESCRIDGVAGCGKTSTAEEFMRRVPTQARYLCFNRSIAEEARKRLPETVDASTFHAWAYRALARHNRTPLQKPDSRKTMDLLRAAGIPDDVLSPAAKLIGLGKNLAFPPFTAQPEDFQNLAEYHNIDLDLPPREEEALLEKLPPLLKESFLLIESQGVIDFDDMLWGAHFTRAPLPRAPLVVVDEAQDTNAIQLALLERSFTDRLFIIGDPFQSIYGFRGADSAAMDNLSVRFKLKHLPLSITYRCPQSHVALAQEYVPHIEAAPGAIPGTVSQTDLDTALTLAQPGDLAICRFNAPLLRVARACLAARVPFDLRGRDIADSLFRLIARPLGLKTGKQAFKKASTPIEDWLSAFKDWSAAEHERLIQRKLYSQAAALEDNRAALLGLAADSEVSNVGDLLSLLDQLFTPGNGMILATVHKAKGLEARQVFWLSPSVPAKWANQPWEKQQERNLRYVALTRAREALHFVEL